MSASLKLYSPNGAVKIDGEYSNIALLEKITRTASQGTYNYNDTTYYTVTTMIQDPIIVFPFGEVCHVIESVIRMPDTGEVKIKVFARFGDMSMTMFIFGTPNEVVTSGPALRIYSSIDSKKVFDSRLKYLKVKGVVSEGASIPAGAKLGWLQREREIQIVGNMDMLAVLVSGWRTDENGKMDKLGLTVWNGHPSNWWFGQLHKYRGIDPLLIDLKNY